MIKVLSKADIEKIIKKREAKQQKEIDVLKERMKALEIKLSDGRMIVR